MASFRLTNEAQADVDDIGRYTRRMWGLEQRNACLSALDGCFRQLAKNPRLGRQREDLRPGLRGYLHGQHLVFYRETPVGIEVVRILHTARDVRKVLQSPA